MDVEGGVDPGEELGFGGWAKGGGGVLCLNHCYNNGLFGKGDN